MSMWPSPTTTSGSPVPTANVDAPTDVPSTARADLDTALQRINALETLLNAVVNFGEPALKAEALPAPASVAFAATLSIDAAQSQVFYIGTLTANVTSMSVSNAHDGRPITIRFVQDSAGGRTVALPSGALVAGVPNTDVSKISYLVLIWVNSVSRFEGYWSALP